MTQVLSHARYLWRQRRARWALRAIGRHLQDLRESEMERLRTLTRELRFRAESGDSLLQILPQAFALASESAFRTTGMRPFDVQLLGATLASLGTVIEMHTGEGKTLTATLPLFLRSLYGKGAHLATANDYLAQRDAEFAARILAPLGVTVAAVQSESSPQERRKAYHADITYGTASNFGFDLMRDLMDLRLGSQAARRVQSAGGQPDTQSGLQPMMRPLYFILVDEADSVLIDEASTPLIISGGARRSDPKIAALYRWAARHAPQAQPTVHFKHNEHLSKIELTEAGRTWVRRLSATDPVPGAAIVDLCTYVERAIKVNRDYARDRNYITRDGAVTIVDSNTGRLGIGREWQDGIHQAIQARDGMEITEPSGSAARLTVQNLILSYPHRAGMTGTGLAAARELRKVYKVDVHPVPTRLPPRRRRFPDLIFRSETEKLEAIRQEVLRLTGGQRPVLIGTRTVEKSERLSRYFAQHGLAHCLLNAHRIAEEAAIIAEAGQPARVTIATSVAGRGTDILLDDAARRAGGLHVILTELHDSVRVDLQLIGRCARQGDPGSFRRCLSADDEIVSDSNLRMLSAPSRWAARWLPGRWRYEFVQWRITLRQVRNRRVMLDTEKKRLKNLWRAGLDPLLDYVA
jgi:preprotein translocase subunit SecA